MLGAKRRLSSSEVHTVEGNVDNQKASQQRNRQGFHSDSKNILKPRTFSRVVLSVFRRRIPLVVTGLFCVALYVQNGFSQEKNASANPSDVAEKNDATSSNAAKGTEKKNSLLSLPFERFVLDNGLEVLLHLDKRTPFVAVSVWYHVGAIDEPKGKSGFAHLFEHLMFQGSENVGKDKHFAYIEAAGGSANGTTNEDRTNYFEVLPRNELDLGLWLESDRMGWLMTSMTQGVLDEQRDVVKNERRQRYENSPYGLAKEQLHLALFPKGHPYRGNVIGSMEELDAASMEDVSSFYEDNYAPSNATLVISGDFDEKTIKEKVKKYFAPLAKWPVPKRSAVEPPKLLKKSILVEYEEPLGRLPYVKMSWFTPSFFAAGDAELDVLAHVLTGSKSARLTRSLVLDQQIAQAVHAYQQSMANVSVFSIVALVKPGRSAKEVISLIQAQLEELQDLPPSDEEVENAVNSRETQMLFGLQKIGGSSGRSELLQLYNHYLKEPDSLAFDLERYQKVTPDGVSKIVSSHLLPEQSAILIATPISDEERARRQAAAKEDAAKEDAAKEDAAKEDATKEDAAKEDATKEDATKEDATKEDATKEDAASGEPDDVKTPDEEPTPTEAAKEKLQPAEKNKEGAQ
ncbi:MAG: insulinase family protein [Deltaproteobacteria bacterium]|nr:insulinase family protein [Deltaproteobacteria bacterium]